MVTLPSLDLEKYIPLQKFPGIDATAQTLKTVLTYAINSDVI